MTSGRARRYLVVLGLLVAASIGIVAASCYSPRQPQCGFICGPGGACPEDYACNSADNRCHLNGSPSDLVCASPDAAADAPPDLPDDAPPDAAIDAPPDASPDAPDDAALDDAAPDAT